MYPERSTDANLRGDNGSSQLPVERAIFREEARQHYIQSEERVEMPVAVSPGVFVYLWILSLILMGFGLLIAFWPVIRQWW